MEKKQLKNEFMSKTIIWGKFHRKCWDKEINNTKETNKYK